MSRGLINYVRTMQTLIIAYGFGKYLLKQQLTYRTNWNVKKVNWRVFKLVINIVTATHTVNVDKLQTAISLSLNSI